MKIELKVPKYIKKIQEKLLENGYECYFVGGCISCLLYTSPSPRDTR